MSIFHMSRVLISLFVAYIVVSLHLEILILVHHHPLWLHAMSDDFLTCLSVLPLSHLNDVMWPLKLFPFHPKTAALQAIVNDVLQEQAHFNYRQSLFSLDKTSCRK